MQAIDRISLILEYLSAHPDGMTLSEIAEHIDLAQSVVHRFLHALKKHAYVTQDAMTKKYRLSLKLFSLGAQVIKDSNIRQVARPHMKHLSEQTNSFVFLCLFENDLVVCVDTVQTNANVSFYVKIGSTMPVNSSAAAQSIVAFLPDSEMQRILRTQSMIPYTRYTLIDKEALLVRFHNIRQEGVATCDEELEPGVFGLSAPIKNYGDMAIGSITILKSKLPEPLSRNVVEELKLTASRISRELGYLSHS